MSSNLLPRNDAGSESETAIRIITLLTRARQAEPQVVQPQISLDALAARPLAGASNALSADLLQRSALLQSRSQLLHDHMNQVNNMLAAASIEQRRRSAETARL